MPEEFSVRRYTPEDAPDWNAFVESSINGTFLHNRNFMDYHSDRFRDHSLLIKQNDKLAAVLPANEADATLVSHGGLTYGGLLVKARTAAVTVVGLVNALTGHLKTAGIKSLVYKPSPHIFHVQPAEADLYALQNLGAKLVRSELGTAIPLQRRLGFSGGRKDGIRKARKASLEVRESNDFAAYWEILLGVLKERHEALPTHSLDEITLLNQRFPKSVKLFGAFDGDCLLAGTVLFDHGHVVHAQYIAANDQARNCGALDLLFHQLIGEIYSDREWFSFGISTTNAGKDLNVGLSRQKEMFGGHSIVFNQYQLNL